MESNSLIKHEKIRELLDQYKVVWSLKHILELGRWDLETYMPEDGAEARGEALAQIEMLSQKLFLNKDFTNLLKECSKLSDLNDYEKGIIRMLLHKLKFYEKLPADFIENFVKITTEASFIWQKARKENNFLIFQPYLQRIVELTRQKAELLGYTNSPYDALLDQYEENLTTQEVENYFHRIKAPLIELINKIKKSELYQEEHELEKKEYNTQEMHNFNKTLLELIHNNLTNLRLDVSAHPFSTHFGKGDVRITTRYEGKGFANTYGSTMHEYGHALYDLQYHEDLHYTPVAGGNSLVIHESQSRFWENFIGRSKEFLNFIYPELIKAQSELKNYNIDEIYKYLNTVKPSLIRVEADEVTYHLHIIIRFEIEKELIEGTIEVKDLPKIWNEKYKKYLGVDVSNDSQGILQDMHWAHGEIGYFPTYSLGTAFSAMCKHLLEKDLGSLAELSKSKEGLERIKAWLKKNIHQYGSTYTFNDLLKNKFKEDFNSNYLLDYLTKKYGRIFNIS